MSMVISLGPKFVDPTFVTQSHAEPISVHEPRGVGVNLSIPTVGEDQRKQLESPRSGKRRQEAAYV